MNTKSLSFRQGRYLATLAAVCVLGCATRTVFLEGNRAFPAKPRFAIEPRKYAPEELAAVGVRTDGVYVRIGFRPRAVQDMQSGGYPNADAVAGVYYYRFWPNGRMIARLAKTDPLTQHDADSFERGRIGYFQSTLNERIDSEIYTWEGGHGDYTYTRLSFTIEEDTLWVDYGNGYKHKGVPVQCGYRFSQIPSLQAQPDW